MTRPGVPFWLDLNAQVPLRDGTVLAATVYRPTELDIRVPALVCLTPYGRDRLHSTAKFFAQNGLAFAAVDCRGRGDSSGRFLPHIHDGKDGYDTVEWFASQNWCSGETAMYGSSYSGYAQWATASERPCSLKTFVATSAAFPTVDVPDRGSIPYAFNLQWAALFASRSIPIQLFADTAYWESVYSDLRERRLPFASHEEVVGCCIEPFEAWNSSHAAALSQQPCPYELRYDCIGIPTLSITGLWDSNQLGALEHYRRQTQARRGDVPDCLIVGPWDHAGCQDTPSSLGAIDFGATAKVDLMSIMLYWYLWHFGMGRRPSWLTKNVAMFDATAKDWRFLESFRNVHLEEFATYGARASLRLVEPLSSQDCTSTVLRSTAAEEAAVGFNFLDIPSYLTAFPVHGTQHALMFDTEPVSERCLIAGFVSLEFSYMWLDDQREASSDVEFYLYAIDPSGANLLLGRTHRRLHTGGDICESSGGQRCELSDLGVCCATLERGAQFRLWIREMNSIFVQKNRFDISTNSVVILHGSSSTEWGLRLKVPLQR